MAVRPDFKISLTFLLDRMTELLSYNLHYILVRLDYQ
jgi:hypothetical protein